jgi:redox-sensitive bicupin YhaK (pirin superfamily)
MGFRALRVLNDDIVEPGAGFGEHGHRDMEIISWVIEGGLEHRDSTGTRGVIRPGDLQVMTAGSGIRHSEMNASTAERVHFLQIWIEPSERGVEPSYGQKSFAEDQRQGRWQLVASPDGRDGSMRIGQDASLSIADLLSDDRIDIDLPAGRHGYLHVATGKVLMGETTLNAGDAISFDGETILSVAAVEESQLLLFDLA